MIGNSLLDAVFPAFGGVNKKKVTPYLGAVYITVNGEMSKKTAPEWWLIFSAICDIIIKTAINLVKTR